MLAFSAVTLSIALFLVFYLYKIYKEMIVDKVVVPNVSESLPTSSPDPDAPINILLLGYGGEGHDGGYLTDTMILLNLDIKTKNIALISIPRDIWLPIPYKPGDPEYFKINHAYAIGKSGDKYPNKYPEFEGEAGAAALSKFAVEKVTGLPVHYFVAIDFSGFTRLVDILGGVAVNVPFTFDDYYYPVKGKEDDSCGKTEEEIGALTATMSGELLEREFKCRYEHLHFDSGTQIMDGETALKFVRSRHSEIGGSDFGRAQRQQAFIAGLKDQILSLSSISKIIPLITEASKNITTDINIRSAIDLAQKQETLNDYAITSISLSTDNVLKEGLSKDGQYILTSKDGTGEFLLVREYIKRRIERVTASPSVPPAN